MRRATTLRERVTVERLGVGGRLGLEGALGFLDSARAYSERDGTTAEFGREGENDGKKENR